jgi:hypothetical protein
VGALANPEVGKYLNEYFCSSYQKVGTFKVVGNQKQGGNVASYFCAPDGRVLHCVAGPVDAATFLREAKWVVATTEKAIKESKGDGGKFKAIFRTAHAEKLRTEFGIVVEPVTYDPEAQGGALSYNDPSGRPLAPILKPVAVEGLDVQIHAKLEAAAALPQAGGLNKQLLDRRGRGLVLTPTAQVHQLMAAHSMAKIETVYASIFEGILGEKISTKPVEVVTPFPWANQDKLGRIRAVPEGGR